MIARSMDWQPYGGETRGPSTLGPYEAFPTFLPEERRRPMSAADPARISPDPLNTERDAAVIDIARAGRRHANHRRGDSMGDPPGSGANTPDPHPANPDAMPAALAERFEETFNEHRLSLTDDRVATAYTVTLQIVHGLLDGANAQGILNEEQHRELSAMVGGVMQAPALVRSAE